MHPRQGVVAERLPLRCCRLGIVEGADIQDDQFRPHFDLLREGGAAFRTKMPENGFPAAPEAGEGLHRTLDRQLGFGHGDQGAEGAAGEFLAVAAMANTRHHRFRGGRIAYGTAEAALILIFLIFYNNVVRHFHSF